jgi:DNA polymerase-3 subunit delta'
MAKLNSSSIIDFSHIIISENQEIELNFLKTKLPKKSRCIVYREDNFKIDLVREIIQESYISSYELKVIAILCNKFQREAQNAMLKILEEPPENVLFVLICPSKSILLSTILSRLLIIDKSYNKVKTQNIELDVLSMSLGEIYSFVKLNQNIKKDEAKIIIYSIFNTFYQNDIVLDKKILDYFSKSMKMIELNIKAINVILLLLIFIYNSNKSS